MTSARPHSDGWKLRPFQPKGLDLRKSVAEARRRKGRPRRNCRGVRAAFRVDGHMPRSNPLHRRNHDEVAPHRQVNREKEAGSAALAVPIDDAGVLGKPIKWHIHFQPLLNSLNIAPELYGGASSAATPESRGVAGPLRFESRYRSATPVAEQMSRTAYARTPSLRQGVDRDPGERFGLGSHTPTQGFTISTPMSSKSRTLRVASLMRPAIAMAAIWQSAEATGRPAERRAAAMWP